MGEGAGGVAELHLGDHLVAEDAQGGELLAVEAPGDAVDDTEGAELEAVAGDQGGAGVEANVRVTDDQRIVGEARVGAGVRHLEDVVLQDGVGAEGERPRGLGGGQADARLEPLAMLVDEADQGDRCAADLAGELGEAVEGLLRRGVEDRVAQEGAQAGPLVVRQRRLVHGENLSASRFCRYPRRCGGAAGESAAECSPEYVRSSPAGGPAGVSRDQAGFSAVTMPQIQLRHTQSRSTRPAAVSMAKWSGSGV